MKILDYVYCLPKNEGARVRSSELAGRQESVRFGPRNPPPGQIILSQAFCHRLYNPRHYI